jgi:hypothetical protein
MIKALSMLATVSASSYVRNISYSGSSFFDEFTFETFDDPTHGK